MKIKNSRDIKNVWKLKRHRVTPIPRGRKCLSCKGTGIANTRRGCPVCNGRGFLRGILNENK